MPGRCTLTATGPAVAQLRPVDLPQRGRGERHVESKSRERLGDPHPELARDDLLHLGEGERLDVVLQAGERVEVGRAAGGRSGWREAGRA